MQLERVYPHLTKRDVRDINMIYDDYEAVLVKYKSEFGDRTVVLFECGSFFEIYDDGSGRTNMKEIGELLGIIVSRRNKTITEVSRTNFEMAGFPSHALKKFISTLLAHQYTVVLVRQVTPPPNPRREVTEVLSPGTSLDVVGSESNNLMVIFLDETEKYGGVGHDISMGCTWVDLSTGNSFFYEASTYRRDTCYVFDEMQRLITTHSPREIEFISAGHLPTLTIEKIRESVNINGMYIHDRIGSDKKYTLAKYQNSVLSSVFPSKGMLHVIEYLNMERTPLCAASFTRLIEFVHLHDEQLVQSLSPPQATMGGASMILSSNSICQLDIAKSSHNDVCMLHLLNVCKTAMGKRYFRHRFLHPSTDTASLDCDFDIMDDMTYPNVIECRKHLSCVYDLERLIRKCRLLRLQPFEMAHLYNSLVYSKKASDVLDWSSGASLSEVLEWIEGVFDVDKLSMYSLDSLDDVALFKAPSDDLHRLQSTIEGATKGFTAFVNTHLETVLKLEYNDKDGYVMTCTAKRWQDLMRQHKKSCFSWISADGEERIPVFMDEIHVKPMASCVKLSHTAFDVNNASIVLAKHALSKACASQFKEMLTEFNKRFINELDTIVHDIERLDWMTTCKHNAIVHKLSRPLFLHKESSSRLEITALRHLLIEHCQRDVEYVPNDVRLIDNGMLLYGINSSGKSSLMKAVGIAVIMAQAGMYVPCTSMSLVPFHHIFTRILTCDDIQRGHSTFTKEILEIRNILWRANEHSLVIGDELCAGTESASAISIVAAGIDRLVRRGSRFLFATHLHDLVDVQEIRDYIDDGKVSVFHLSVHCDPVTQKLVYQRTLRSGSGCSLYGIEVCRAMKMDDDFLEFANNVRQRYVGVHDQLHPGKSSHYNQALYIKKCDICKKPAEEVHHIRHQKDADAMGYIGSHHKNAMFNLVALCRVCHDEVHAGTKHIKGYIFTSNGRELSFENSSAQQDDDMKREMRADILAVFADPSMTKKAKYEMLSRKWNITKYRIDKILRMQ